MCSEAALRLGISILKEYSYTEKDTIYFTRVQLAEVHKTLQTDMFAMMKAGVLATFPEVARWLLMHSRIVGRSWLSQQHIYQARPKHLLAFQGAHKSWRT